MSDSARDYDLLDAWRTNAADPPCPNCGKPLPHGHVFRAGMVYTSLRTIPQTPGRGEYCDHIRDPNAEISRPRSIL